MRFQTLFTAAAFIAGAMAKNCNAGVFSNECVTYFSDGACGSYEGSYVPTCEGNCFKYDFKGIVVQGNSIYGTACTAYYDDNCQQPFGETGNEVATSGCNDFSVGGGAKSMKCYFDC